MALVIKFESGYIKEYHIGLDVPISHEECRAIAEIQANGDELEYIINKYTINPKAHSSDKRYTIPIPFNTRIVRWFGDIAQTIIANL